MTIFNGSNPFVFASILGWFVQCSTVATPFQRSLQSEKLGIGPETKVVVALTEVELQGGLFPRWTFWSRVGSVRDSLESQPGYLGGSIRREMLGSKAWTMTVWKDEEALESFIYSREHKRAMKEGAPAVGNSRFFRTKRSWGELPIPWSQAEKWIAEEGREE